MRIKFIGIFLTATCFLISCNTPESDGVKAAKLFQECEQNYIERLECEFQDFISGFDDYHFTTRIEARQKVESILAEADHDYEENMKRAQQEYIKLKRKYLKNEEAQAFEYAYNMQKGMEVHNSSSEIEIPMSNEVNKLIRTIIPPKPSIDKIKTDLVGHTWQDKENGYFGGKKSIIKEGSVKEIKIVSSSAQPNTYNINAIVNIQERVGSATFIIDADITYLLGESDDWTIDYLGVNSVDIVKTGQYDKYIETELNNFGFLFTKNHSEASLIVGGVYLDSYDRSWYKFSIDVNGNSGNAMGRVLEYEIHFVERR